MKIGYFANGPWSYNAFKKIIEDPRFKILFVVSTGKALYFSLNWYGYLINQMSRLIDIKQ